MVAPLDLTGRRFGSLVVLARGPKVKWGRWQSSWHCRCDCGAIITVPQQRLPHRDSIPEHHRITACDACRSKPCLICGTAIPPSSSAVTCSIDCRAEHRRQQFTEWYQAKRTTDPEWRERQMERSRQRYRRLDGAARQVVNRKRRERELALYGQTGINARGRKRHIERMEADPEYRERLRIRNLTWRHQNPDAARTHGRLYRRRQQELTALREIGSILERDNDRDQTDD